MLDPIVNWKVHHTTCKGSILVNQEVYIVALKWIKLNRRLTSCSYLHSMAWLFLVVLRDKGAGESSTLVSYH